MDKKLSNMLRKIGLTEEEALIFYTLLIKGELIASEVAEETKLGRANTYVLLRKLVVKGLVNEYDKRKKLTYKVEPPQKLVEIVEERKKDVLSTEKSLLSFLPNIISDYNIGYEKPGVNIYEDMDGIKKIYKDILRQKEEVKIYVSTFHKMRKEMIEFINNHIEKQAKLGIEAKAIISLPKGEPLNQRIQDKLKKNLTEVRILEKEIYPLPAQIFIYSEKVAVMTFRRKIITTIIQNEDVFETFNSIFNFIWLSSTKDYKNLLKKNKLK